MIDAVLITVILVAEAIDTEAGWIRLITGAYLPGCRVVGRSPGNRANNIYLPCSDDQLEKTLYYREGG